MNANILKVWCEMWRKFFGVVILLFSVNLVSCSSGIKLQFQQPAGKRLIGIKRLVIAPCEGLDDAALICNHLSSVLKQKDYFVLFDRNKFSSALEQHQLTYEKIKQPDSLGQMAKLLNIDGIIFSELKTFEILPDEQGVNKIEKSVWTGEYERDENGQIIEEISPTGETTKKKKYILQTIDQNYRIRKAKMSVSFQLIDLGKNALIFSQELIENYTSGKIIKEESQTIPTVDEIKRTLAHDMVTSFLSKIEPKTITVKRVIETGLALIDSGAAHARAGRWSQAAEVWNQAQKIFPTDARIYYNLGLAAEAQGDYESAEVYYKQASLINSKKRLYKKAVQYIRKMW
ncbi:MAG: tetratricopeptide repeat protein [bacterium]|nr:MAG: tetratricopeptide repeat protein [bacterium]